MNKTNNVLDAAERASRLFGVGIEKVTQLMKSSISVLRLPLPQEDPREAALMAAGKVPWPNCPLCSHSATHRHAGKHTCVRCGWREG